MACATEVLRIGETFTAQTSYQTQRQQWVPTIYTFNVQMQHAILPK